MKRYPLLAVVAVWLLAGCTTLEGPTDPEDPFESFNRSMYSFNETIDEYALKPVAQGYTKITPVPVRKGVGNFFSNLDDVVVIFNDLLQLKIGQFFSDIGRVVVNSTVGIYGLIDWASDMGLEKHDEDFGQTLGYWGLSSGPYLVLPFFGPSSVRDTGGLLTDRLTVNPISNEVHEGTPFPDRPNDVNLGLTLIDAVDTRARLLGAGRVLGIAALDPYIFVRDAYLQRRENLVYDGNPPDDLWDDEDEFDTEPSADSNGVSSSPAEPFSQRK